METQRQDGRRKVSDKEIERIMERWRSGERIAIITQSYPQITESGIRRIINAKIKEAKSGENG